MDVNESHVQTLIGMGFPCERDIRRALLCSKNDLNDAVAILTDDNTAPSYDHLDHQLQLGPTTAPSSVVGSNNTNNRPAAGRGRSNPADQIGRLTPPPPTTTTNNTTAGGPTGKGGSSGSPSLTTTTQRYNENLETEKGGGDESIDVVPPLLPSDDGASYEFPVTNLYELEGRVFVEQWSIPYRREESLGKCLLASTYLADAGFAESNEDCKRFLDRCMPEAFKKLMTFPAVHRWTSEIQEGIYNMLQLLIDLVVARLQHLPVPIKLLDVLSMAFDQDAEFHFKNRARQCDKSYWKEKFGNGELFAINTSGTGKNDPYGWLTNLINRFAYKNGFEQIKKHLDREDLDAPSMAALLRPFGICADFLNPNVMLDILAPGLKKAIKYVQSLEEKDFKEKKVGSVSDLLASMKLLCMNMWPKDVEAVDALRLDVALRMLKSPHFNAKMNSLKEVSKLIDDATVSKLKTAINSERILDFLVEKRVLAIALEGNIDQAQYCDKVKGIVDFLGAKISLDELNMIWKMQNGQSNNVIDNIHSIIAAAAVKFDAQQLEQLFFLIQKKWQDDNDRIREKLLSLIGKIGKDARLPKTTTRVLELLWDLSHLPALSTHLIEQALNEHLLILSDSYIVKEQVKRQYVMKCVEDIKKGAWVLPALKQLLHLCRNISKQSFNKSDKGILYELNKNQDVVKLVTGSLMKCHKMAASADGALSPSMIVDGRYTHSEYVSTHLNFLQYILQVGIQCLTWNRAREIWSTLVANQESCDWDKETCYEWFSKGIGDLEAEAVSQLFQKELLKLDPSTLSEKGFACVKNFFETANLYEHKLKRSQSGPMWIVEKPDLCGLEFLWETCLNTLNETIAEAAIELLLDMSYSNLTPKMKKDPVNLHKKFITECYNRLEVSRIGIGGSVLGQVLSSATKILTAAIVPDVATGNLPSNSATKSESNLVVSETRRSTPRDPIYFRPVKLLNIERLLWIAEAYILNVEESHVSPRSILPHGTSFQGQQINLNISCESPKQEFTLLSHSNEMLGIVRFKVAGHLRQMVDNIQIVANEKLLNSNKDQKLLHQLDFEDNQILQVRISSASSGLPNNQVKEVQECFRFDQPLLASPSNKQSFDLEQEKMLPGVIMAIGGQVFDMLYQLAELEEPKITSRVRKLLMLIPTDPTISDAFDSISQKLELKQSSSSNDVSPRSSPKKVSSSSSSSCSPLCSSSKQSPQDLLKSLLDSTAPEMSAFRLLYNLEVLSSKLMPTGEEAGVHHSARHFCDDFLLVGGLGLVVRILQPEAISSEVCYSIRQGCYSICLQLARFLLCGQTVTGEVYPPSPQATVKAATGGAQWSVSVSVESSGGAGSKALQTMTKQDFGETVACLMRITWAAAAGRLHLMSVSQPIRESTAAASGRRSRQSSTGSTGSTGSESEGQTLHAGVCAQKGNLSTKDSNIAREALEILITCLQLRSSALAVFYSLPCVHDFIVDILVGSPQSDIRNAALEHFYQLSRTEMPNPDTEAVSPHKFLLKVLLKSRLPFWVTSSAIRGSSQRLLNQCSQYFELRCRLLEHLSAADQKTLMVDVSAMLEDEIGWLNNFVISEYHELRPTENMLLAGHLKLCKALFTCEGINKEEFGPDLVYELLYDFLFPASKLIMENSNEARNDEFLQNFNPKCSSTESRVAAYELLTELAHKCLANLEHICKHLIRMHHLPNPECSNEWEYMPPVDGRADCGFVGLKNGGATCYMNSVLQQIFMVPGISEFILSIDEHNPDEESVFYQVQHIFGHLTDSKLQYHEPESFWKVFKLWGQTINVHEQQDAFDFFQALSDQIDEQIKNLGREEVFKKKFQGIFSDQKICKDCPHRYEREEPFFALNLTVKNATLQDSLDQFVKGELLEGDNAYFCEKCREKRNTIKRMCIKTLPPLICIQLKRFGYDWEAQKALKFDDYFKFPWVLDMEPYTEEGMARQESEAVNAGLDEENIEKAAQRDGANGGSQSNDSSIPGSNNCSSTPNKINYELVGIVVHSGQANAGHYYSFIKDRRGTVSSNPRKGCWFKFNDITVEEYHMTDVSLEAECFGGFYKAKVYDQSMTYPEERIRYWNGYMLYYERMDEPRTPLSAKKTKVSLSKRTHLEPSRRSLNSDSLVELTELVHKGEKRGMFTLKMPASIEQVIRAENIIFVKNRDVYNAEYFRFIKNLAACNTPHKDASGMADAKLCEQSLQLGMKFLFHTYFRAKLKTKVELDDWVTVIETLMSRYKDACMWLVEFMDDEQGYAFIKSFLLECPNKDVRLTMAKILERMMSSFFQHGGVATHKSFDNILGHLLQMLNKDLPDNIKNCIQYFLVLKSYVQMGTKACIHIFFRKGFNHLINFLLGTIDKEEELSSRRWIPIQARDFGHLQTTLATLILNCDVSNYRTEDPGPYPVRLPQTVLPQLFLKMSDDMHYHVFGPGSFRYINEVVYAVREVSGNLESVTDMLLYCSFCNSNFSMTLLECLMIHYQTAPCNEVRSIFFLLMEILLLKDPLQLKRLKWAVIDGHVNEKGKKFEGLLSTIRSFHLSDSSRSYQCIKFLVQLCNRCSLVKDQLMKTSTKWQWAVKWLEKKMSDYWAPSSTVPLSNEDSNQKSFQRTVSAQDTLDSATALLTEIEANDNLVIPSSAVVGHRNSLKSNYTSMQSLPDDSGSSSSTTPTSRSQVSVSMTAPSTSSSSSDKTSLSSDSGNSTSTKRAPQSTPLPNEGSSSSSSSDTISVSEN